MQIGILQTGRAPEALWDQHGDYHEMSRIFLGLPDQNVRHYAVLDGEFPDSVVDCDAWFITGSRHGVYEDHDWIPPLEAFIRSAHAQKRKMVGICFGHQIIAQALGGVVKKYDKGFSVGAVDYTLLSNAAEDSNKAVVRLHAYHQDQIVELPEQGEVFMTSDFCRYAGLKYGSWGLTVQPHPEFLSEYMKDLIEIRQGSTLDQSLADLALSSLSKPMDCDIKATVRSFLGLEGR